ncbi:unnamed protein product [Mycena citricolor]|uniref:DUF2786 domain-containing protein n=1 Tax=Mycena citricolor TaxID=2018698 RepID=A0AAD2H0B6_9AGAR|nr:unnamed protein product [Mycena citricolor]
MPKRRYDTTSDSEYSDSDFEATEIKGPKRAKRTSASKSTGTRSKGPATKAEVTIRATDAPIRDKTESQKRLEGMDAAVIGRIKKALALAAHPQTGEDEARAALRMASKMLERHNVTQADIMSQESESEKLKRVVSIRNDAGTPFQLPAWTSTLSTAMDTFFDCQSYSTKFTGSRPKVDWSFYGLQEQTVAAAHAFEMTYNLILAWSQKPEAGKGTHAKNCYRSGVAYGLYKMAQQEKADEKSRAVKKEQALLQARQEAEAAETKAKLVRLEQPQIKEEDGAVKMEQHEERKVKIEDVDDEDDFRDRRLPSKYEENADEEDNFNGPATLGDMAPDFDDNDDVDNLLDLDAERPTLKRRESPSVEAKATVKPEADEESPWASVNQLVAFREATAAIGDDYLKSQGIKLEKGRKSRPLEFKDAQARSLYQKGKDDAKKIDVRRKQIKNTEMD